MKFCPPNVTLDEVWVDHGISHCFLDTVTTATIFSFILIAGVLEWIVYRKYASPTNEYSKPRSKWFYLQTTLFVILPIMEFVRFLLESTVLDGGHVYGYMIMSVVMTLIMWPVVFVLVISERNYMLPSVPTQGHGFILLLFWTAALIKESLSFFNLQKKHWWFDLETTPQKVEFGFFVTRYCATMVVFFLGLWAPGIPKIHDYHLHDTILNEDQERNIGQPSESQFHSREGSAFRNAWWKMKTLMPYIWPKKSRFLQFQVMICFVLLILGRVVNVYTPIFYKLIVDSLTPAPSKVLDLRWDLALAYVAIKFLQGSGSMGLLNNLRSFIWIKVQQYTTREIQVKLFSHLHSLSLRWHLSRKTGEVLRVMDRGTNSINTLLSYIIFNILPTFADIFIAIIYFISAFNAWFGLIVFVTMALYLASTIVITEWRTKYRRSMNLADNEQSSRSVDSLLNFETVKYYGAEDYEAKRYKEALVKYQVEEWKSTITLNILNTIQNVIISAGLLAGTLLCMYFVVDDHTMTVGDYVLFASYIMQLYMPLNWFGTYYRSIQKNFVDMENMLDLFEEKQEVIDDPNAKDLQVRQGQIEFRNVSFSYVPEKPVLKNVSFIIPPGETYALVGSSGGGKSTIIRLLFRFYDLQEGEIYLDGQNVRNVTQSSVRKAMGVVPQDTVLFNDTIMYNIKYGRVTASDEEVKQAAASADIHDKITSFPDQYQSKVGERGLKLSGGEKQRVAIARTMLKAPHFILLDEATSALDTQTERNIQSALQQICYGKTTLIVAHRLSTIIHSHQIMVLKDGEIVERGRHSELLALEGEYAAMWEQQLKNDQLGTDGPASSEEQQA